MMSRQRLTEEMLDFLAEMMNIGSGNAATALNQMLQAPVEVAKSKVHITQPAKAPTIFGEPASPVTCVRMGMVGDVLGDLYFIVPDIQRPLMIDRVRQALPHATEHEPSSDLSEITEIANITAGVYLRAINDFCGLKVYHTVPTVVIDMIQAILDESIAHLSSAMQEIIIIENVFVLQSDQIHTYFVIMPRSESIDTMVASIDGARAIYGTG